MADLSVTAGSVARVAGKVKVGKAGETITAGQVLRGPENALLKAQCDAQNYQAAIKGIALNGGTIGQPISYLPHGLINVGATLTVGTVYVLSDTAGGIMPLADLDTAGWYVTILGVGKTAANLILAPIVSGIVVP